MKRITRTCLYVGRFLLFCALTLAAVSCGTKKLSFDELRGREKLYFTGGDMELSDTVIQKRLSEMDRGVRDMLAGLNTDPERTYLWNDAEAQDDSLSPFRPTSVTTPISRIATLAVAYATQGSEFYQDPALRETVIDAMEWMYANKWSPNHPMYGNWWDWIIGMPLSVNRMLIVMYEDFTPEQRAKYIEALDYYAPDVSYEGASTGANKIWQCYSMIQRGILAHDGDKIRMGVDGLDPEFVYVDTHDGFYRDGSFIQHQWHPYTGGYGSSFIREMARVMMAVHGSKWQVKTEYMTTMCEWVENSYLPLIYQGAMMDMVRGREIAREHAPDRIIGHQILYWAYNIAMMAPPDVRNRVLPNIKYQLASDHYRDFLSHDVPNWQLGELREFMLTDKVKAVEPAPYHKQFSMMDRVVHVRPGFAVGLAMSSRRIENYESIDSENMMAWHTGDGMTYFYTPDQAQYSDNYWSTVDWYRLPGITLDAEQRHEVKSLVFGEGVLYADGYKSPQSWVGGSSLEGTAGISGMWFNDEKSSLEAKKTWFMVGDEIVALGAGIHSRDSRRIEIIVDNRKLNGPQEVTTDQTLYTQSEVGEYDFSHNRWVHLSSTIPGASMGYYFLTEQPVKMELQTRTGTWRAFSKYGNSVPHTREYFTLSVDHGKNPAGDTYAYVVLPGKSVEEVRSYAAVPNQEVIANTAQVQAVRAVSEGITGINFWEVPASPVAGVHVSAPASVMIKETADELLVGLSDPTQLHTGKITVEADFTVSGVRVPHPNVEVISLDPLRFEVDVTGGMGQTFPVSFQK